MEDRLTHLETKVAFQDELLEQLNQVIISQQASIDELTKKLERINETVKSFGDPRVTDQDEDPPPHY